MSLNYVALTFTMQDAGQDAQAGSVVIFPTSVVTAAGVTVVDETQVVRSLASGTVTVSLVACDNTGTTPVAGFWAYNIQLPGGAGGLYLVNYSNGASQRFDNLSPAVASTTYGPAASGSGFSNPMTTLGDIMYENATPAAARLAGSTSATKNFLTQTGTGSVSAAPAWGTIATGDVPQLADYAPTGLTGATGGASRYVGGTTSGPPASGTFAVGDFIIDQSGVQWICRTAGTPGTWIVAGDRPWQFRPESYGAAGDGKIGTGGTGTSGTATFTDAGASFVNAAAPAGDVGKVIIINQGTGGSATHPFVGTISAVNSGTSVTLSGNLAANAATAPYIYGTDDSSAINSAVSAASTYAQANNYHAQILFGSKLYMTGTLTQQTSPVVYNTHIPVPVATQTGRKLILDFIGVGDASAPMYWESTLPSIQGTCIVSAVFAVSQPNGTYGNQSVIGGPTTTTGLSPGNFANTLVNIDGISVVAPWDTQEYGYDFRYLGQANLPKASYLYFAPVNLGASSIGGPYLSSTNIPPNGQNIALVMPITSNNDNCNVGLFTCEGSAIGVQFSEHFTAQRVVTLYCEVGMWAGLGGTTHGASILYYNCEASQTALRSQNDGGGVNGFPIFIGLMDTEVISTWDIYDPNGDFAGYIGWADYERTSMLVNGAANVRIVNNRLPRGLWSGAPAVPATTVAQQNTAFRDATVYLTSGGAAVTVIKVDSTTTGLTLSTSGTVAVRVPSGHSITLTYASTAPTWVWVLD